MQIEPNFDRAPLLREGGPAKEMLSVRHEDGKTFVRINSSSLAVLQTCMRKSQYMLKEGLKAKTESPATCFGSAIHSALEAFYRMPREARTLPPDFAKRADLVIPQDATALALEAEHFLFRCLGNFVRKAEPLRALPDSDKRSLNAGVWSLTHYFTAYIDDPFVVLCDAKGPITERFCEAVLYDSLVLEVTYFGTVDVVLFNERTGVTLPCDHKTSSVVGNDFYVRVAPNHQYTGYLWLAQKCLGLEVDSFLVNCIQVKPRPTTARGTPPHFPRQVTKRSPDDIEEFREAVLHAVRSYLSANEQSIWPLGDVNSCSMYGSCTYHSICSSPKSLRENIIDAAFAKGSYATQ